MTGASKSTRERFRVTGSDGDGWRCSIDRVLQRPVFQSKGAALAFVHLVVKGKRDPEPTR